MHNSRLGGNAGASATPPAFDKLDSRQVTTQSAPVDLTVRRPKANGFTMMHLLEQDDVEGALHLVPQLFGEDGEYHSIGQFTRALEERAATHHRLVFDESTFDRLLNELKERRESGGNNPFTRLYERFVESPETKITEMRSRLEGLREYARTQIENARRYDELNARMYRGGDL